MLNVRRTLTVSAVAVSLGTPAALVCSAAPASATVRSAPAPAVPNSHWESCNSTAVSTAPKVLWNRIAEATTSHKSIPSTFWSTVTYRRDIVRIVCYESSFKYHANGGGQYGWYQMSSSLISSEGITWHQYWWGDKLGAAGWYQCYAGELYIHSRYGNPVNAWNHEANYGWY